VAVTHRTPIGVRFSEVDPYGHVNHAVYVVYCEEGRTRAFASVGLDLADLLAAGRQIVIVSLAITYRAPAHLGDELVVETSLRDVRGASAWFAQRVVRGGTTIVEADVRGALTDTEGRPRRLSPDLLARLERLRPLVP
jgi:YbgC/YbaW family acyl-CoA thioester hydrolase